MDEFKLDGFEDFLQSMGKRPLHRVISQDLIAEQSDDDLEVTIFDIAWAIRSPNRLEILATLPQGYSIVYSTMALEAEVSNGGFNQFFYNPTRELFRLAVDAYAILDLPEIVALVEKANEMYGTEARFWKKAILLLSETLSGFFKSYKYSSLGDLDEQMWAAKEAISANRVAFIRDNPSQFTGDFRHLYSTASNSSYGQSTIAGSGVRDASFIASRGYKR